MSEFKKNAIATEEDYFDLSDAVYDDRTLHKGAQIKGHNKRWVVIESIDADCQKVKMDYKLLQWCRKMIMKRIKLTMKL